MQYQDMEYMMKITLTNAEIKEAVLDYCNKRLVEFYLNTVQFDCSFGTLLSATVTYEKPPVQISDIPSDEGVHQAAAAAVDNL